LLALAGELLEVPRLMWKTIGWLSLMCGTFIGLLISLAIIGLKG